MPTATKSLAVDRYSIARFWPKVARRSERECWLWQAGTTRGYGQFHLTEERKPVYAHRVAWVIAHGPIPENLAVLHHCDVPLCVNPSHLFLGTQQDNLTDARQKGRLREDLPRTNKLTYEDRLAIFFSAGRGVDVAREYGVTTATISQIRHGRFAGAPSQFRPVAGRPFVVHDVPVLNHIATVGATLSAPQDNSVALGETR